MMSSRPHKSGSKHDAIEAENPTPKRVTSLSDSMTKNEDAMSATRRTFVQTVGVAAGVWASGLPQVHAASGETIRVGLIGCGGRGTGAAINVIKADPAVRIVALADLFESPMKICRKNLARRHSEQCDITDENCFVGFDSYEKLLQTDVDVVLLASPPYYRPDHFEASVNAGKEIFCEKPVATDPEGVRRVRAACKLASQKGLNVVSGLCWRYDQGMQQTINEILEGRIGTIVTAQTNYLTGPVWAKAKRPDESELIYQCRNWYNYTWLSGDHIVEQFIHGIDKMLWLHEDLPPVSAYGIGGRQNRISSIQGNIYDHFSVVFEWANDSRAFAHTRQMRGCYNQTEDFVFGTDGVAHLCRHEIKGVKSWRFQGSKVQMHQAEQNEFMRAVRGERPRIDNGNYMCNSTLMAIMGREVCYSGQALTFDEVAQSPQALGPAEYVSGDAPSAEVPVPGKYRFPKA